MCRGMEYFIIAALSCFWIMMPAVSGESILVQDGTVDDKDPVDIGARRELFVDEFLIQELSGAAERRMHRPAHREVVHVLDKPWEGNTSAYLSVVQDKDRIRIYYNASPRRRSQTPAVIESRDGVNFSRPNLGIVDFEGSTDNNLLPRFGPAGHHFTPFIDTNPAAPPEERYKAFARHPVSGQGFGGFVSSDGIDWEVLEKGLFSSSPSDSQNVAFWDPVREKYVAYAREFDDSTGRRVRTIRRAESPDFRNWTETGQIAYTDDRVEQMYTNGIRPYFRAPHIYIGLPNRFVTGRKKVPEHPNAGINDVVLMSSRDGKVFDRWEEAFIRPGPEPENWTDRNTYPSWGMAQTSPEEISIYWTEHYRYPGMRFRRGTIRTDGFVSVQANAQGGEMTTRPLVFSGDRLVVNYATSAAGGMRFELQDKTGDPLPGFSLADSEPLYGNAIEHIVSWRGGSDVSELRGRPVRLRVSLEDADLYSIRFDTSEAIEGRLKEVRDEAAVAMDSNEDAFDRMKRERVAAAGEQLEKRLLEEGAPTQPTIEAAERLRRVLQELEPVNRAAVKARDALESAKSVLEHDAAFGTAYQMPVSLIRERLATALDNDNATAEEVTSMADRLQSAIADYQTTEDVRAEAGESIASASEVAQEPGEGWAGLFQGRVEHQRAVLERVLADPHATLQTAKGAIRDVEAAISAYREVEDFPAVDSIEVAGVPAVFSVSDETEWETGLLVNVQSDGDGLITSDTVALRFTGEGAYVQCSAADVLKPDTVTVEAWLKIEDEYLGWFPVLVLGKGMETELAKRRPSWSEHAYNLWAYGNGPQFTLGSEEGAALVRTRRGPTVETGKWQHVAGQFDGREARIYINGRLAGVEQYDGAIDYHWSDALRIGGKIGTYHWFVGQIRDVRVWNTVRSEEDIREYMHGGLTGDEPGLVGRWIVGRKAGTGEQVFDNSSRENHGELVGTEWVLPKSYRLADPIRFSDIFEVQRSAILWRASVEGAEQSASMDVLVGLSDSPDALPDEWRRAASGGPIPFIEPGMDLSEKHVWLKTVFTSQDPSARVRLHEVKLEVE